MTTFSILVPFMPTAARELHRYGELIGRTPGARLWQGQAVSLDPLQSFAELAGAGHRIPVGLAVTLMPLKHPFQAAMEARSLSRITGHTVRYGLGPGPVVFQELLGLRPKSQLGLVREYIGAVRDLLAGTVSAPGVSVTSGMPLTPLSAADVELALGVLRPRMAALTGEVADRAITWLAPAAYLASVISPALASGAALVNRDRPPVTCVVPVALRRAGRNPYRTVLASNFGHMTGTHYQDMLLRAGVTVDPSRPGPSAKALLDSGSFVHGDLPGVVQRLAEFIDAGADEIVLNLAGVHAIEGPDAAFEEAAELLEALTVSR